MVAATGFAVNNDLTSSNKSATSPLDTSSRRNISANALSMTVRASLITSFAISASRVSVTEVSFTLALTDFTPTHPQKQDTDRDCPTIRHA